MLAKHIFLQFRLLLYPSYGGKKSTQSLSPLPLSSFPASASALSLSFSFSFSFRKCLRRTKETFVLLWTIFLRCRNKTNCMNLSGLPQAPAHRKCLQLSSPIYYVPQSNCHLARTLWGRHFKWKMCFPFRPPVCCGLCNESRPFPRPSDLIAYVGTSRGEG